jgi:N5-(cytidine 5'-diphosphoramidyl)-L-glutamine hydrolase
MIKIGVTQRLITLNKSDIYDALENSLMNYFRELGFELIPIPNFYGLSVEDHDLHDWLEINKIKKLLLSGGGDPSKLDERYRLEDKLMSYSKLKFLPLFGICRGLERLIMFEGGTLKKVGGHINASTTLTGEIQGVFKCFHNLSVDKLPDEFRITAVATDDTVESVVHKSYPWEGCMWHPERTILRNPSFEKRLQDFFHKYE